MSFEDTFYLQMTNYHFKSFDLSQSLPISPSHSYGKTVSKFSYKIKFNNKIGCANKIKLLQYIDSI